LAPKTTEDFPQEVGVFILEKASKLGLAHVVIINAHNSINNPFSMEGATEFLKEAAWDVLKEASKLAPSSFEVGAAKVMPKEFSFERGMGPGGVCALVLKVGKQTCAYITIDGNNMVSGLREKILGALKELGVDEGEVLTTDTHVVNAIGKTARGYHPLGEAIPHEKLINYTKQAVKEGLNNIKPASVSWSRGTVPNIKVIGERQIEELSELADRALHQAKKTAVPLFAAAGLLLTALLIVL
jgi:putative membrane protein